MAQLGTLFSNELGDSLWSEVNIIYILYCIHSKFQFVLILMSTAKINTFHTKQKEAYRNLQYRRKFPLGPPT